MQTLSTIRNLTPAATAPDFAVALLRAAVHEAPAAFLLVTRGGADVRVVYANKVMQELSNNLLADNTEIRLVDLPLLGIPVSNLLNEANAAGGSLERQLLTVTRNGQSKQVLQTQVKPLPESADYQLIQFTLLKPESSTGDRTGALAVAAAEASGIGHWQCELLSGKAWYDKAALRLLNFTGKEPSIKALLSSVLDEDQVLFLGAIRRHLEQNLSLDVNVRLRTDNEPVWLRLRGCATRDSAGLPIHLSGVVEDVTQQLLVSQARSDAHHFLRGIFDSLQMGVAILDAKGKIIELNRAWAEFSSSVALVGSRFSFGENYARVCRALSDRCVAGTVVAEAVEAVLQGQHDHQTVDYHLISDAGDPQTLRLQIRVFLVGHERGAIITQSDLLVVDQDSRLKRETDAFYRMMLNAIPLSIFYVDRSGKLLHANRLAEESLGQPITVLQGRSLEDLLNPQDVEESTARIQSVLAGRRVDFESHVVSRGRTREMAVSYIPHVVDACVVGFFSIGRDVADEKRLEAELLQANKMEAMGRLTSGIAHDFNNLLSVIIGNLQLMERQFGERSPYVGQVRSALGAATRGADLTKRLLSFSRPKARNPMPLDVNPLIAGLQDLIAQSVGGAIQLRLSLAAGPCTVRVDANELENALLNLAINARDAMAGEGLLTVTTRNLRIEASEFPHALSLSDGQYVEIQVVDSGCGMSPEIINRVFEPFFTTKDPGKGTGLGLSIVYGFAVRAGGTVVLDSAVGRGTVVRLLLPFYDSQTTVQQVLQQPMSLAMSDPGSFL